MTVPASNAAAWTARVQALIESSIATKRRVAEDLTRPIVTVAECCANQLSAGGKLMLCGNGGSAADAQHLAAELLVRLRPHVNRQALPAIALGLDASALTACGNDLGFDVYFERMVQALGRPEDVLIAITTSGRSRNVILALEAARAKGIVTVGLLGGSGGAALAHCDHALIVPSTETGRIQESHIMIGHALMELIEDMMLERGHPLSPVTP